MDIIIPIKPQFAEKILEWVKNFELRRAFSKKEINKVIIYESAPVSKVVGEFEVKEVLYEPLEDLWNYTKDSSCVNREFFDQYFKWKEFWYAVKIKNPKRYKTPKLISEYWLKGIPQSYVFLR